MTGADPMIDEAGEPMPEVAGFTYEALPAWWLNCDICEALTSDLPDDAPVYEEPLATAFRTKSELVTNAIDARLFMERHLREVHPS